jgi:hypothetical protein
MDLSTKTVRELIVELKHIEDALRGAIPVTMPDPLRARVVARQDEICAELRRRFGGEPARPGATTYGWTTPTSLCWRRPRDPTRRCPSRPDPHTGRPTPVDAPAPTALPLYAG